MAAVPGDPGQRPLDHPAVGQDLEGVQVIAPFDDLQRELRLPARLRDAGLAAQEAHKRRQRKSQSATSPFTAADGRCS